MGSGPFMEVVDNNTNIKYHRHYTLTMYFSAVMSVSPFKATVEFSSYYLVLCFFVLQSISKSNQIYVLKKGEIQDKSFTFNFMHL